MKIKTLVVVALATSTYAQASRTTIAAAAVGLPYGAAIGVLVNHSPTLWATIPSAMGLLALQAVTVGQVRKIMHRRSGASLPLLARGNSGLDSPLLDFGVSYCLTLISTLATMWIDEAVAEKRKESDKAPMLR